MAIDNSMYVFALLAKTCLHAWLATITSRVEHTANNDNKQARVTYMQNGYWHSCFRLRFTCNYQFK